VPNGKPLDLVNPAAAGKFGLPLSLWTYNPDLRQKLNSALYVPDYVGAKSAPASVIFEYSDGDVTVRKAFSFDHSYVVKVECRVTQGGKPLQAYPAWPAGFGDTLNLPGYAAQKIEYQSADKVNRIEPKKVSGGETLSGPFHWAGPSDQYFAAVFLPDEPENAAMVTLHESIKLPKNPDKPDPTQTVDAPILGAAVGGKNGDTRERLFVGPKALDVLDSVHTSLTREERATVRPGSGGEGEYSGPDLTGLVDFGRFFGFIAKPLFLWLKWTHDHWIANWGWDILILTIIIAIATLPLKISSMKSAMKMAKVQPQVKAIQEKYKKFKFNDPKKAEMNKEMSELYKREGVNPVGGCFPMLIQLPFLIAFYSMLGIAIELRHAPWLWLRDLSSPDPLYILPVFIVISMFFVQRMTPQAGMDPAQAKMMAFMMPLFIGGISLSLASGLGIYWAASNLLGIAQQWGLNQTQFGREIRESQMKRARKT
jgi:YidC/Oxa1 family membrane protein insertase